MARPGVKFEMSVTDAVPAICETEEGRPRQQRLLWHWCRRITLGLFLFTWALMAISERAGALLAFWLLIGPIGFLGAWEMAAICRPRGLTAQVGCTAVWLGLVGATVWLRLTEPLLLLWAIYLGGGYDVVALATGRLCDPNHRYPLIPSLSQRKTVAGTLGGLGGSWLCGASWQLAWLPEWTLGWVVLTMLPGSAWAFLGDLLPSALKKQASVRHSGEVLPRWAQVFGSHGGALDRCLSVLATAGWIAFITWLRILLSGT